MLSAIELENFKGVSERTRIELAPVTLLFGANNAGKSTVLHALLYAYELLVAGHADVDRTTLGGQVVDLGGFASFVHGGDTSRNVCLRVEVALDTVSLPDFSDAWDDDESWLAIDIQDELYKVWVELEVANSSSGPYVRKYLVGVNDEPSPVGWLEATGAEAKPSLALFTSHPVFRRDESGQSLLEQALSDVVGAQRGDNGFVIAVRNQQGCLPSWEHTLFLGLPDEWLAEHRLGLVTLSRILVGAGRLVRSVLAGMVYIGPLRAVPDRNHRPQSSPDPSRWSDGLSAWDHLFRGDALVLVNSWLSRLKTKLRLERYESRLSQPIATFPASPGASSPEPEKPPKAKGKAKGKTAKPAESPPESPVPSPAAVLALHKQTPAEMVLRLVRDASDILLTPRDVGVGISQVLPILVAALLPHRRGSSAESRPTTLTHGPSFVMVEQPELHIHPAMQTELGDLLITQSKDRQFLIETHSEHLILRLLRRIRETTEGTLPDGAPSYSPGLLLVLHVDSPNGRVVVKPLRVDPTGEFVDRWPHGFFAERAEELF